MALERRLIVVANRLPVQRIGRGAGSRWELSGGGLVTALRPILKRRAGVWVGWTGDAGEVLRPFTHDGVSIVPVGMSDREIRDYYHGFCNRTIWPLFHDGLRVPEFSQRNWLRYRAINHRFAAATAAVAAPGDRVWVQDYQLLLTPSILRQLRPDLRIGFLLHIPFPPEELFGWLPWRQAILRGMLGSDLLGFQTSSDARNFSRVARRYAPAEGTDTLLRHDGRRIGVNAFPISIDVDDFERTARLPETARRSSQIRQRIGATRRILLSVDRLDYTKGMEQRLRSFHALLRQRAATVDDVVFVQIAVPSREQVPEYVQLRTHIEQMVGRINGEFSQPGLVAVHYFRRSVSREELLAYYRAADVMLVTPLRDGMNLVAKEYVACRFDHTGVLVLSEFAGAADEMRHAVLVNPHDIEGSAAAFESALNMPPAEAGRRMRLLRAALRRNDVFHWAGGFLENMSA